ncbi:MAG TPA: hypothetical protein VE988_09525 [Gemmataceae bacterium]|nr:hypothetical protein [Gemmataceae bacterium]
MSIYRSFALTFAMIAAALAVCEARADDARKASEEKNSELAVDIKVICLERDTADHFLALAGFQEITGCGPDSFAKVATLTDVNYQTWLAVFEHDLLSKLTIDTVDLPTVVASSGETAAFEFGGEQAIQAAATADPQVSKDRMQSFFFLTGAHDSAAQVGFTGAVTPTVAADGESFHVTINMTRIVHHVGAYDKKPHAGKLTLDQMQAIAQGQTAVFHIGTTRGENLYTYALPGLSDLPKIGDMFQVHASFQGEREVFVLVTPRVVPKLPYRKWE